MEALQAEGEVNDVITMITQVEVTRRMYYRYTRYVQYLQRQEKIYEQNKLIYERERRRISILIEQHHRRVETAKITLE